MQWFVFFAASVMVLVGAVGVVLRTHPVHAALSLVLTLFGIAVLFISLDAQFLAAVQVIVYAGAIVVLFLFVIMLLGVDRAENLDIEPFKIQRPLAGITGLGVGAIVITAILKTYKHLRRGEGEGNPLDHDSNIRLLARNLFSDHVLAFELTSVLLVIAVVGTVLLARKPSRGGAPKTAGPQGDAK